MRVKVSGAFALWLTVTVVASAEPVSFYTNDFHEVTILGDVEYVGKHTDLDGDDEDSEGQFQSFDLGIWSKYFNSPSSYILTKVILDFSEELDAGEFDGCIGNVDCIQNKNSSVDDDIVEELRFGYSYKRWAASIGKIPAYADTINVSESYDSVSFAGFDDEILIGTQRNNDPVARFDWIGSEYNLVMDVNLAVDKDNAKAEVLKGGVAFETLWPWKNTIFSLGIKDAYSALLGKDVLTAGFSLEDILYDRSENSDCALDLAFMASDLGNYSNISFSYFHKSHIKFSAGVDHFNASGEKFERAGRIGSDRTLVYLNGTYALYKYYKFFAELNHFEFGDSEASSVLIGIGSSF